MQLFQPQVAQFAQAQTGCVGQLQNSGGAQLGGRGFGRRLEELVDVQIG